MGSLPSCKLLSRCSEPLARRSPEKDRIRRGDDALKIHDRLPCCSHRCDRLCVIESIVGEQILQGSQQLDGSHAYQRGLPARHLGEDTHNWLRCYTRAHTRAEASNLSRGAQGEFSTVFVGPKAPRWSSWRPVTTGRRSGLAARAGALQDVQEWSGLRLFKMNDNSPF